MIPRHIPLFLYLALLPALLPACESSGGGGPGVSAEFLLLAGDSTFWVKSKGDGERLRTRGSPIQLARYAGKFYELYVGDDDRSYYDAIIVGQRIFRRDLVSGDSVAVFEDSTITAFAEW